jgi:hypothetical protein
MRRPTLNRRIRRQIVSKCGTPDLRPTGLGPVAVNRESNALWGSDGDNIPAAHFGLIETLIRDFEQFLGC